MIASRLKRKNVEFKKEQKYKPEEEIAQKIKAGVEEESFYRLGFEKQKSLLKSIKFEEGEAIRKVVHNVVERCGDEGFQLLKYVDFENVEEESLLKIVGELESIPIIRECNKLIKRLTENDKNKDKNEIEIIIDWEKLYREEAKQRQTIEAELKVIKSKYEEILSVQQRKIPQVKEYSQIKFNTIQGLFKKKDMKSLTNYLSKDPSLIFIKSKFGNNLLHLGAMYNWVEGLKVVIEYGFGIEGFTERANNNGETALIWASFYNNPEAVEFLVSKGANIEAKENKISQTALVIVAGNGYLEIVKFLVSKGANIEVKDKNGNTPLILACSENHLEVVKFLVSNGANIEEKSKMWEDGTALTIAVGYGYFEIVKFLVSKGANIKAKDMHEKTPLILASEMGRLEIVKFLVSNGANIDEKMENDETALMGASSFGRLEVVEYLASIGANIESKGCDGGTALMWASSFGQLEVVEYLITIGANIESKDSDGDNALMVASRFGYLKVVEYLVSKGVNIEEKNNNGKTALMHASEERKRNVVKFLTSKGSKK